MIDNFALVLSHGLILLAAWKLTLRPDLDDGDALLPEERDRPKKAVWKDRAGA